MDSLLSRLTKVWSLKPSENPHWVNLRESEKIRVNRKVSENKWSLFSNGMAREKSIRFRQLRHLTRNFTDDWRSSFSNTITSNTNAWSGRGVVSSLLTALSSHKSQVALLFYSLATAHSGSERVRRDRIWLCTRQPQDRCMRHSPMLESSQFAISFVYL